MDNHALAQPDLLLAAFEVIRYAATPASVRARLPHEELLRGLSDALYFHRMLQLVHPCCGMFCASIRAVDLTSGAMCPCQLRVPVLKPVAGALPFTYQIPEGHSRLRAISLRDGQRERQGGGLAGADPQHSPPQQAILRQEPSFQGNVIFEWD